jgi:hypothetical protein
MATLRARLHASRGAAVVGLMLAGLVLAASEAIARAQTAYPPPAYPPPGPYPPPEPYPPPAVYPPTPYGPPGAYAPPGPYPSPDAYPPPAAYGYPGRRYTSAPRPRLFQLIPYIGLHSYQGAGGTNFRPGLHVGGLTGFRVGDFVSLNVELTFDLLDASNLTVSESYSEIDYAISFSPLVAIPAGTVELAFGPKLGVWAGEYSQSSRARGDGGGSYSGFDLGVNAAAFVQVGRKLWLGGLASFDVRTYGRSCFTPSNGMQGCSSVLPSADEIVALSILLMFST